MAEQEPQLPSKEEIAQLPRWAKVAFAARCARRVQPLFGVAWPKAIPSLGRLVGDAIAVAEQSASSPSLVSGIGRAADLASHVVALGAYPAAAATGAGVAVAAAAEAAARAAEAAHVATALLTTIAAAHAAQAAARATAARTALVIAMRKDLKELAAAAKKDHWTEDTAVPPGFFGPLWPEGEPPGWPSAQAKEKVFDRGPMSLFFDRAEFSNKQIGEIISLLSELYRSVGGDGLVIEGMTVLMPEREPVPEGV